MSLSQFFSGASSSSPPTLVSNPYQGPAYIPLMMYNTSSFGASSSNVNLWPNLGTGGSMFNFVGDDYYSNVRPVFIPASGGSRGYVKFNYTSLKTLVELPLSFTGTKSRTIGFIALAASGAGNLISFGQGTVNAMFDIMTYGTEYLVPHTYGSHISIDSPPYGLWNLVEIRLTDLVSSVQVEVFVNAQQVSVRGTTQLNTSPGIARLGLGVFATYNTGLEKRLSGVYFADKALTNSEMASARTLIGY